PPSPRAPVQSGPLRPIAAMSAERSPILPDVPTTGEQGMPEWEAPMWAALFSPKGTPAAILDRLADALNDALDDSEIQHRIIDLGSNVPNDSQRGREYTNKFVLGELTKWRKLA